LYHPLGLADASVHAIAVHWRLAQSILPVLLWDNSKVVGRPLATEPVSGLHIFNQPIDRPKKVLVLGRVDLVHLRGLHMLLQHLHVVCGNRYAPGVLEGVLDHLLCIVVEHGVGFSLANSVHQTKMFLPCKRELNLHAKVKTIKIWNLSTKLIQNIFATTS
jgi:hypothetical protein